MSFFQNESFQDMILQQRWLLLKHISDDTARLQDQHRSGRAIDPIYHYNTEEHALMTLSDSFGDKQTTSRLKCDGTEEDRVTPSFIQEHSPTPSETVTFGSAGLDPPATAPIQTGMVGIPNWTPTTFLGGNGQVEKKPRAKQPFLEYALAFARAIPIRAYASAIYRFDGIIYRPLGEQELKTLILQVLKPQIAEIGNPQALKSVADFLLALKEIQSVPSSDTRWLCLKSGVLDLETDKQYPASAEYFFTSFINTAYDSQAHSNACPVFMHFLNTAMGGDPIYVQRVLEIIGYLLVPDMRGKVFFHFVGVGDSGKSVLGNLIASFFNPEAVSNLDIFRFGDRFSTSALVGKRLNLSMDLPKGRLPSIAVASIKQLTGGDAITVEEKYKPAFSYRTQCKFLFGSNQDLVLMEADPAFSSREVNVVFRHAIPKGEQDQRLLERFQQEKPGIFNLALAAYKQLRQRNFQFSGENQTLVVLVKGQPFSFSYKASVAQFVQSRCNFDEQRFTTAEDLHIAYHAFCTQSRSPFLSDRASFSSQLCDCCGASIRRLQKRVDGQPKRGYQGIYLRSEGEPV